MFSTRVRLVVSCLGVLTLSAGLMTAARADTRPPNSALPATVSADALPTVQINGVAWAQVVVGNTVYVTGDFTSARPPGSPAGTNETPRANLLAYDITTGKLLPFNHTLNSTGRALSVSPDKATLYIAGSFTKVDGKARSRVAAFNLATGALVAGFAPVVNSQTNTVLAASNAVYLGGQFSAVSGVSRTKLAAVDPVTGAVLNWAPSADGGPVAAMVLNASRTKLIVGGQFTSVNLSGTGYGIAALDPSTGATLPWTAGSVVQDAGKDAGVFSLSTDGTQVFGTGWVFGAGGNFEGAFAADGDSGNVNWLEDCHGDTYGAFAAGPVVYVVGHAHYCGNIGGFPEATPSRTWYRATAFTNYATGTVAHNASGGYADFYGQPAPTLLDWFPTLKAGTYTGQSQAAWTVVGNANYVSLAGEFPYVNGAAQEGLTRFAVSSIAPNKVGPKDAPQPTVTSFVSGTARVAWQASSDQDNEALTYDVIRDGKTATPAYTTTVNSTFWNRPTLTWTDKGLVPGSTHTYRVSARDAFGNIVRSTVVSVTVSSGTGSTYANDVLTDGAADYWRLDDTTGSSFADAAGASPLAASAGITRGVPGMQNDPAGAAAFDGTQQSTAGSTGAQPGANTFTVEAWFSTTSTSGGKIVGFGNSQLSTSSNYDRHIYLDDAGHVIFGVYPNAVRVVSSPGTYNDGAWHAVTATLSSAGMVLYVDGQPVASDPTTTTAQDYSGYWRVGGDNLNGWPATPSSQYFTGVIDDVAVYPTALSADQVRTHYQDTGRTP